ncbi:hypothetical protein SDJN02_11479 [Cucurbita argyrosperma subsp. argyrosperma]
MDVENYARKPPENFPSHRRLYQKIRFLNLQQQPTRFIQIHVYVVLMRRDDVAARGNGDVEHRISSWFVFALLLLFL